MGGLDGPPSPPTLGSAPGTAVALLDCGAPEATNERLEVSSAGSAGAIHAPATGSK